MTMQLAAAAAPRAIPWDVLGFVVVAALALLFLMLIMPVLGLWIQALAANAKVSILEIVGMRLRRTNPSIIVISRIQAVRAGVDVSTAELERYHLAGGQVVKVVRALIAAKRADVSLSWQEACAIDLSGRDVLDIVKTAVEAKTAENAEA